MGVLTFGLLGVAALFPVGSHYMRTGEEADRGAAVAKAAFAEVVARGMLNPDNWMTHITDGRYGTSDLPFADRFKPALKQRSRERTDVVNASPLDDNAASMAERDTILLFGSTIVIDPLGVSHALQTDVNNANIILEFPVRVFRALGREDSPSWAPWSRGFPVRRLSLAMPNSNPAPQYFGQPVYLSSEVAKSVFTSSDDLVAAPAASESDPSRQLFQRQNNGTTLVRQSQGDYSWLVTIAPSSSKARDALASDPSAYYYNVSVVVFNKRVIDDLDGSSTFSEKLARGRVVSKSLSGGELLLERVSQYDDPPDLFHGVKPGQWVMVFAPHTRSRGSEPALFQRWYRVLAVEGEDDNGSAVSDAAELSNNVQRRLVSLRGPAWPWNPANSFSNDSELPNDLRVAIIPNAVAVHSRDMRLEGPSVWSVD